MVLLYCMKPLIWLSLWRHTSRKINHSDWLMPRYIDQWDFKFMYPRVMHMYPWPLVLNTSFSKRLIFHSRLQFSNPKSAYMVKGCIKNVRKLYEFRRMMTTPFKLPTISAWYLTLKPLCFASSKKYIWYIHIFNRFSFSFPIFANSGAYLGNFLWGGRG